LEPLRKTAISNSFDHYYFDPPDIGRLNDYALQINQIHRISIIIDPRRIQNIELTLSWIQRPLLRPARESPPVDQMQHYVGKARTQDTMPLA